MGEKKALKNLNQLAVLCYLMTYPFESLEQCLFTLSILSHGEFANTDTMKGSKARAVFLHNIFVREACLLCFVSSKCQINPCGSEERGNRKLVCLLHLFELLFSQFWASELQQQLNDQCVA